MNRLFTLIPLLLSATGVFATSYYVDNAGSDANTGTSPTPGGAWLTIAKVNSTVFHPGDALYFAGGQTFSGGIDLANSDLNDPLDIFIISSYGVGSATINATASYGLSAYNKQGLSISNLIFDGGSMLSNANSGLVLVADVPGDVKFSNISISNVEVKNFGAQGIMISGGNKLTGFQNVNLSNLSVHDVKANGIVVYGDITHAIGSWPHKDVSISNCEVYGIPGFDDPSSHEGNGIMISQVDAGVIQNCTAHDNGESNTHCGGPGGIWCWDSNKITIQYCESYKNHSGTGCDGLGFDFDGGMTHSVMQYNYAHDNDGAGFLLGQFANAPDWSNDTVRYNISENDGVVNEGSIGLFKGPGTTMNGACIYNNTIYVSHHAGNSNESAVYFQNWNTGINNVNFYNNILLSTGGVPFINIPTGYSAFFAGNIYWASGGAFSVNYQGINYSSLDAWRLATNNEVVASPPPGPTGAPLLANPGFGGTVGFGKSLTSLNAYKINSAQSPAFGKALDLNSLYSINVGLTDFWGTILPGGNSNDIGANQYISTLPVKLLGFRGNCSGSGNHISWAAAEELNLKSFDLMYSRNGINFSRLAEISPKGNNSEYSYVNDLTSLGNNYYQLKMIDLDGRVNYSSVINVKCETPSGKTNVWPNPFTQTINVFTESAGKRPATIALNDAQGRLVLQREIQLTAGNNLVRCDGLEGLPAGVYYLRIVRQDIVAHFKLIKTGK